MAEKPYIKQDQRLQAEGQAVGEKLCKLRWHWTLDESNPEQTSFAQYARDVGVTGARIAQDAKAWVRSQQSRVAIAEARVREQVGAETEVAMEALAEQVGIRFSAANAPAYRSHVREIREVARDRAASSSGSFDKAYERETKKVAKELFTAEPRTASRSSSKDLPMKYMEASIRIWLIQDELKDYVPSPDERERLLKITEATETFLAQVKAYLIAPDQVDWDGELAEELRQRAKEALND